ncbi:MAG TPA: hypothetical protein VMR95_03555 [Candidatus Binatia bacterium]|nr:hypothetical protein [Candidatus Binatia bacterium]
MSIDGFDYDGFEAQADEQFRAANAELGQYDENPTFDFCDTCTHYRGFTDKERAEAKLLYGGVILDSVNGAVVAARLVAPSTGKTSRELLLGSRPGDIYTGEIANKLNSDAAQRTRECTGPKRSGLLGVLGVKHCGASIPKFNSDY